MNTRDNVQNRLRIYSDRLEKLAQTLQARSARISTARLIVFLAGVAVTGLVSATGNNFMTVLAGFVFIAMFLTLVVIHRKLEHSLMLFQSWREIKLEHLARSMIEWDSIPDRDHDLDRSHAFAFDLDLVGQHSLHQLIDCSTSLGGSHRLLRWLTANNPKIEEIRDRQELVRELIPRTSFRDKLTLKAKFVSKTKSEHDEGDWLMSWLSEHSEIPVLKPVLVVSLLLAIITISLLSLSILGLIPQVWIISFTLYIAIFLFAQLRLTPLFEEAMTLERSLNRFTSVFRQLENARYSNTPKLKNLCEPFLAQGMRPSTHLSQIERIVTGASLRRNTLLWILANIILPWDLYFGNRFGSIKSSLSEHLPTWLNTWFELEALSSIANFAHLNPGYVFPKFNNKGDTTKSVIVGRAIGHPLLDHAARVCNDFEVPSLGSISIVTGSNMSGKSTFLRTLGVNLALGQAGGPVCADSLSTPVFRIFSCIQVSDSVTDGFSYFYAEVRRLKLLLDELAQDNATPVIYFIDEIFRGTNNRERLIGSRSYVKAISGFNGIGLISTHDLELVTIEEEIANITNYHFREEVLNGSMSFDYKLQAGPCPTTNALTIMKLEGLPIDPAE